LLLDALWIKPFGLLAVGRLPAKAPPIPAIKLVVKDCAVSDRRAQGTIDGFVE
jgi:hypothetical protein